MISSSGLWTPLLSAPFFEKLEGLIREDGRPVGLEGLVGGSRALTLTLLSRNLRKGILVVTPDDPGLEAYHRDLAALAGLTGRDPRRTVRMPALDSDPFDGIPAHPEVVRERVVAVERLLRDEIDFLLVPVRGLLNPLPSPEEWRSRTRTVRRGDTLPPDRFVLTALGLGYRRVDTVSGPAEVSRRGGIVDIFPPTAQEPVRIELFGDTVDSLRSFDTDNQRSTGQLDEVIVGPAVESPPTEQAVRRLAAYLEQRRLDMKDSARSVRQIQEHLELLHHQGYWPGYESLTKMTATRPVLLFEHARNLVTVVDEPERCIDELVQAAHDLNLSYEEGAEQILPPAATLFADAREVRARLADAALFVRELIGQGAEPAERTLTVSVRTARAYSGRVPDLVQDLRKGVEAGKRIVCVMRAPGSADRLSEILDEYDLPARRVDGAGTADDGSLYIGLGALRSGFELQESGLSVLTEREIFGEERKKAKQKGRGRAAFLSDFRDLKEGDVLVHVDHGIARYAGLGRPRGGSLNRDFIVLEFAGGDKLFVPADRLDLVQKYSGVAGRKAALDRLGGPGWGRVLTKVRKAVQSMAKELLELYARRQTVQGHAFAPDTPWQQELEDAFPFELTPDQDRAVHEIKADMESTRPMDRLLVGDVGFGKTELAVRAAFKSVMDGRQVALLSPTTVLSMQHFETFRERFAPYPVRVEMVSRFRSASEIRKILAEVAVGSVDVLVGTHRLLSKDVEFKQLGLLLVDEEQRFGVAHKERIKRLSIGVDVLSMTATPIPRTLQMSLAGVRDLSVIETPPQGRLAIQTYLVPFRKNQLAQAIRQELRRGGQVFVVHNKIDTLPAMIRAISEMAPDARIVSAHGRMPERHLERVMMQFVGKQADILVTTTIIENGLDIPSANTIIVNRADRFGLAQLYQLRGRVGRSREHAYAYFIIPSREHLRGEARKRLLALQEFSDLGAGFRLAAADLEIRGAGELLGGRQHGHIAALGFEMYCRMLERGVSELQGEPVTPDRPVTLNMGVDIKLTDKYLPEATDRLVLYKRLAQATTPEDVDRLQAETEDRFGHLPQAARNLFDMGRLRLVAVEAGVKSVDLAEEKLQIRFHGHSSVDPHRLVEILGRSSGSLSPSGMMLLPAPPRGADRIQAAREVLWQMLGVDPMKGDNPDGGER